MPWFLVGVATREYDVPYRNGRSFFEDGMVRAEEEHLKHFIAPYRDEELILFWDICDEPEWYSKMPGAEGLPYDRTRIVRWVQSMYDAIRSVDSNHLITLGFGHIATANYGMDVRDMAEILDLMAVTAYPGEADEGLDTVRNNYTVPFHVKMNSRRKPVFTCEAPGMSSISYSEDMIGRYYRTSLYSNLVNGSTGALSWVYNDFEESVWHEGAPEKYLIEPSFGIISTDGRLKPSGKELQDFAAFVRKTEIGRCRPKRAEVAVLVPEGYYRNLGVSRKKIYTAYLLAKGCGVDCDLVWTSEGLEGYRILLLPTTTGMTTSMWDTLRRFVEEGGIVYHSYESGSLNIYFNRLFGVEVQTQEADRGYRRLTAKRDWAVWRQGDEIILSERQPEHALRVRCKEAETLFAFDDGKPALLRNRYGKGTAYLAVLSLDNGLMQIPYRDFLASASFVMVNEMIREARIRRILWFDHPAIEVGWMEEARPERGRDGIQESIIICISHDPDTITARMSLDEALLPAGWELRDFETGERLDFAGKGERESLEVSFAPAEIHIYQLCPV